MKKVAIANGAAACRETLPSLWSHVEREDIASIQHAASDSPEELVHTDQSRVNRFSVDVSKLGVTSRSILHFSPTHERTSGLRPMLCKIRFSMFFVAGKA